MEKELSKEQLEEIKEIWKRAGSKIKESNKELSAAVNEFSNFMKSLENDLFVFYCNYNEKYTKIHRADCDLIDYSKTVLYNNHFWSPEIKSYNGCLKMLEEFLRIRDFYATVLGRNECDSCMGVENMKKINRNKNSDD
jgi:hypothetical protein